jgi:hypothetical protein
MNIFNRSRPASAHSNGSASEQIPHHEEEANPDIHIDVNVIETEDIEEPEIWEDNPNFRTMMNDPLGQCLIGLVKDTVKLSDKAKVRSMTTDLEKLCNAFVENKHSERAYINSQLNMAAKEVEKNILDRELNSHAMNSSMLEPPKFYSEVPTLTSIQKLNEVLKIFPRAGKFSGNLSRDNGVSVCEYLNSLTSAQNQCLLSEEEFIDRIIGSCTAQAHDLVMDWKLNGNSASEIYSNLINNFDNRMSISEAKQRLATFVIYKNSSLAKAEAAILHLLTRASADFLPGPTRIAYRDIEGIRA